jgi:hypothetical protein
MGLRSVTVANTAEDWDPRRAETYLREHAEDGDPEVLQICRQIVAEAREHQRRPTPIAGGGRTAESPFVSDDPPTGT